MLDVINISYATTMKQSILMCLIILADLRNSICLHILKLRISPRLVFCTREDGLLATVYIPGDSDTLGLPNSTNTAGCKKT